jgi:hypothetical protein
VTKIVAREKHTHLLRQEKELLNVKVVKNTRKVILLWSAPSKVFKAKDKLSLRGR